MEARGKLLVEAAEVRARELQVEVVFALTNRAGSFFENLGYRASDSSIIPEDRANKCEESGRTSIVFTKDLG